MFLINEQYFQQQKTWINIEWNVKTNWKTSINI